MSRKVINIILPHLHSGNTTTSHRMEGIAKMLSSSFNVHVFTFSEKQNQPINHSIRFEQNLTVHYIPVNSGIKSFLFIRAFFECWYLLKLIKRANSYPCDLMLVSLSFILLIPFISKYCKAEKLVADISEPGWQFIPLSSTFKNAFYKKVIAKIQKSLKRFDRITVTHETEKDWLVNNFFYDDSKIAVISEGISQEKFKKLSEIKYLHHPEKFTITYFGCMDNSFNFYSLLDVISEMKNVKLNLVDYSSCCKNIRDYVIEKKISNVFIHENLSWSRSLPYYQTSDLLFTSTTKGFETSIPSRLFEFLATGLPILYLGSGTSVIFLEKYKNTFILQDDDAQNFEKIIWKIKCLSLSRSENNIQSIRKNFISEKLNMQFVEISANLLNEKQLSNVHVDDILQGLEYGEI